VPNHLRALTRLVEICLDGGLEATMYSAQAQLADAYIAAGMAADAAMSLADWPGAAAVLQEFVTRVPNHIPALMRLVEICVDGGLESTMYSAQAQLADAYIEGGHATEARFIAEDLVAREPWDRANIERFRKTLVLLGEPDPDGLIAARLSGESPFLSTDLNGDSLFDEPAAAPPPEPHEAEIEQLLAAAAAAEEPTKKKAPVKPMPRRASEDQQFAMSANAIDLDSILGDLESSAPVASPRPPEDVEVDLSISLDTMRKAAPPARVQPEETDLDGIFGAMRTQSARRSGLDEAEKEYKRGLALRKAGDIDGCIEALEKASQAPKLRFGTSWLIALVPYSERAVNCVCPVERPLPRDVESESRHLPRASRRATRLPRPLQPRCSRCPTS